MKYKQSVGLASTVITSDDTRRLDHSVVVWCWSFSNEHIAFTIFNEFDWRNPAVFMMNVCPVTFIVISSATAHFESSLCFVAWQIFIDSKINLRSYSSDGCLIANDATSCCRVQQCAARRSVWYYVMLQYVTWHFKVQRSLKSSARCCKPIVCHKLHAVQHNCLW